MGIIRLTSLLFFISFSAIAQTSSLKNKVPYPTKYSSASDQALVIKTVTLAPVFDNVNDIYKKPVAEHLKNLIKADQFWAYADFISPKADLRIDDFEESTQLTMETLEKSQADGLMTCFIIKGPKGLSIQLNLYSKDNGKLLLREDFNDENIFEVAKVNAVIAKMYATIKSKLPFSGYITSRQGNSVTVNIGSKLGVKAGDTLTVAQIIKVNRHPKLNFMTSVEKEIIGRISLSKVDSDSSFGEISMEKENGVVERGSKILPLEFVKYPATSDSSLADIYPNEKNPGEWLPARPPQFGKMSLLAGFTDFSDNSILADDTSLEAGNSLALTFDLTTELWITPEYFATLQLQQASFKADNDLSGSTPGKLNYSLNKIDLSFGYKYLIDGNFWGPQVYTSLGYYTQEVRVSDSVPTAFTSTELTGMDLTVGGLFPVTLKNDIAIGAQAKFLFFENLSEGPVNSGDASASFNQFDVIGSYQYTTNVNFKGVLSFSNVQTTFNGSGTKTPQTRSLDEKISTYLVGIEYLF